MWAGVFTALSEIGGIQQVSRHSGAVLEEMARERGESCLLLSLNDQRGLQTFVVANKEYSFRAFGRSKLRLVFHAIRLAPRLRAVYFGHVHLAPLGLLLRLFNHGLRYWVAGHGVEVWYPVSFTQRLALRGVTGVVAVSTFTRDRVITVQGVPQDKVVVLSPGVDPDFDDTPNRKDPLSLPPESRVILSVGRLVSSEPGKGIDTLIRALAKVLRAVPNSFYVVVGDGDDRPRLERLARDHDVEDRVLFVGEVKADQLKNYYLRSNVFAMPSRQEGFGLVFLEAMAFGKPVIAANYGGTAELVKDGVTGFRVEYDNVDLLADRLICLLLDENLSARMGEAGRHLVKENYTFERFRSRLTRILGDAVS